MEIHLLLTRLLADPNVPTANQRRSKGWQRLSVEKQIWKDVAETESAEERRLLLASTEGWGGWEDLEEPWRFDPRWTERSLLRYYGAPAAKEYARLLRIYNDQESKAKVAEEKERERLTATVAELQKKVDALEEQVRVLTLHHDREVLRATLEVRGAHPQPGRRGPP